MDVLEWLRAQERKELLRFVAIGSVDDGKSTLIGRLLHDAHGLYEDQLHAVRRASAKGSTRGSGSTSEIDFSLFTDGLKAEREQGITIDVAYRYFATARRKFIIADTPGHVQYTRNMATGASTADVALILVDARLGVLPQTRRHARIAALLGIHHVVACVNKMDLVGFDQAVFERIRAELTEVGRHAGLRALSSLPVSALAGDNVVERSPRFPWWDGAPLLELLETLPLPRPAVDAPFRLPVQLVLRPGLDYRGFSGQIASGTVRAGDEVVALPSGLRTRVVGVDLFGKEVAVAAAPSSVALRLADEIDVSRGDMLVAAEAPTRAATELSAHVVWMAPRPLDPSRTYLLKHTTRTVRADVPQVFHVEDPATLTHREATSVELNDIARVRIHAHAPILFDPYTVNRTTGAFILIDPVSHDTVAAGMLEDATRLDTRGPRPPVSDGERRARWRQSGAVVTVRGPDAEEARRAAEAVERELFDRGHLVALARGHAPQELAAAGLVAVAWASDGPGDRYVAEVAGTSVEVPLADGAEALAHAVLQGLQAERVLQRS